MKNLRNKTFGHKVGTYLFLSLLTASIISCSSDDGYYNVIEDEFNPPSAAQFNDLRETALEQHTETAIFNAEDGITFTSNDNAVLTIHPGCLMQNGEQASGEVELTFIDIYNREDMLPTNKPVMGRLPNGDKAMLITGGEFFIEVRKDGELLDLGCSLQLLVPGDNTGGVDNEMILWDGIIDEAGNLTWEEMDLDEEGGNAGIMVEGEHYYSYFKSFGWTNIDKFYSDPRDKTTMQVKLPEGFDDTNSAVYLSYDGEPNALAQLDTFDDVSKIFSEHYGQIPIGLEVHIIFTSAEGDNWRYAIQGVTIEENAIYTFTLEETEVATENELKVALEVLP